MTKISQLSDIGAGLAAGDEFVIRDVSDATTPNKKVTASGFMNYVISQSTSGNFSTISAGTGPLSRVQTTFSGATGTITFGTASAGSLVESARIDSSGRLLVGTFTARAIFNNTTGTAALQIEGSTADTANLSITRTVSNAGTPLLTFAKSRGSVGGTPTVVASGDGIGYISFEGADGTEFVRGAAIAAEVDGTPGADDMPGRLVFSTTADGASSPTERLRIDSSGNIGIRAAASTIEAQLDITNISGTGGLLVKRSTTVAGGPSIRFLTSSTTGQLQHTGDLQIQGAAVGGTPSEIARFTTAGQFRLAGAGITFNGDTATANELDDYEEGTFTPTIVGTSTAGTGTYTAQVGRYTKIGNRVSFSIWVQWSAHTGTGNMRIGGFPVTTVNSANVTPPVSVYTDGVTMPANTVIQSFMNINATTMSLATVPVGGGTAASLALQTSGLILAAGVYESA